MRDERLKFLLFNKTIHFLIIGGTIVRSTHRLLISDIVAGEIAENSTGTGSHYVIRFSNQIEQSNDQGGEILLVRGRI